MFEYLIKDELLQSSDKNILSREEFEFLYPQEKPELTIKNIISFQNIGFQIQTSAINHRKSAFMSCFSNADNYAFKVFDPSMLLKDIKLKIARRILKNVGITNLKTSSFTESWDAFRHFYQGEKSWRKLDITRAQSSFEASLHIDSGFVLAKLRLAEVLNYGISKVTSKILVSSVHSHLHLLGEIDSLKAEALTARLSGNQRKAISILREIYDRCPSRKRAAFDVAEAYYRNICEINDATEFYQKCLALDKTFSLAHNHPAYCYSHEGLHEKALWHYKIYLKLDTTANAYDSMGDGYMAAGKLDSAIWAKKKGVEKDPRLPYLYQG
jgi:tetratricopeptide (TPR) repeat protein